MRKDLWTEKELQILETFMKETRSIKQLLPGRSINAIHIKMCQLRSRNYKLQVTPRQTLEASGAKTI